MMNFVVRRRAITSLQEKDLEISDIATTFGKLWDKFRTTFGPQDDYLVTIGG